MRLKNRKSYITSLPEGKPPKEHKVRITQLLYFFALFALLAYLAQTVFDRWRHFDGKGRIEVEKTLVSSRFGGRITSLAVQEGEDLQAGDPIAQIEPSLECEEKSNPRLDKLQDEIALKTSRLEVLSEYLVDLSREVDASNAIARAHELDLTNQIVLRRALEVGGIPPKKASTSSQDRLLNRERQKIKTDLALLKKEIALKKRQLGRIKKRASKTTTPTRCLSETVVAPFAARVQALKLRENEFARRGEAIVTLVERSAPVRIEALFENKLMPYLTSGRLLEVSFPDGWRSQGRVESVSSPDYAVSAQERALFVEDSSHLRARILPLNDDAGMRWLRYDRMEVHLRGKKKE